jgi:hypothetical protein
MPAEKRAYIFSLRHLAAKRWPLSSQPARGRLPHRLNRRLEVSSPPLPDPSQVPENIQVPVG